MQGVFTNHPIPRMGGLGIFLGFIFSVLIFVDISVQSGVFCLGAF
jgi:UDP-GlcNAc:undecaprenyl-phosphate GlcNAc-1-phosphate transferase